MRTGWEDNDLYCIYTCGELGVMDQSCVHGNADALSVDTVATVSRLREAGCRLPLMGNVSTFLLHQGPVEAVRRAVADVCEQGFSIVAPACGISGATPVAHLRALVDGTAAVGRPPTSLTDTPERR